MKMIAMAAFAACALTFVTGCAKEETPAEKAQAALQQGAKGVQKAGADAQKATEKAAADVQKAAADAQKKQ